MDFLIDGIMSITWQQVVMWVIGALLIYLAIKKDYEPALLLPMGFGAILVNLPLSGAINQTMEGIGEVNGIIDWLFNVGIEASEAMPLLLFIGIGAMIDFGPLLSNPKMFLFGAAAQFGIFLTITVAVVFGFGLKDAAAREKKGIISFSPLAQGMLTDRYLNGIPEDSRVRTDGRFLKEGNLTEEKLSQIRALNDIAAQRGEKLSQMALKWILRDGVVTSVLIGASKPEQILDNLKVLESAPFTEEELKRIDEISLA